MRQLRFQTGARIPYSGIYRIWHPQHRLPDEVTLLQDQIFPLCSKCEEAVEFELVMAVREPSLMPHHIVLHRIPVIEEEERKAAKAS